MKTWSTYIILAAFVLAGCSDEMPDNPVIPPVLPVEDGTVALTIQFPNSGVPSTYAISSKQENEINNLHILSFTSGGAGFSPGKTLLDDKLAYHLSVTANVEDSTTTTSNIKKAIKVKVKNMLEKQRLVLVANVPSTIDLADPTLTGKTMKQIVEMLKFSGAAWRAGQDVANFPMFGQMTDSIQFHSKNQSPTTKLVFNMIRAVAKVDVGVDLNGTGDPALGFGDIFKIQEVYVYNASEGGYIAPHDDFLKYTTDSDPNIHDGDTIIDKVNLITPDLRTAQPTVYTFPSGNILERSIYIPESDILHADYTPVYNPAFLVVKATYYDQPYFYRIDFVKGNEYVPVLRNHNYVFNITGVRAEGYASKEDAAAAPISRFSALELNEADDIGLKEVVYTNDYYLAVSSTYIEVNQEVQDVDIYVKSTFTNGAWETVGKTWGPETTSSPGVGVLSSFRLHTGANTTGEPIIHSVSVKSGMLTSPKITIVQRPGANSYITQSGSTVPVTIYVKSANKDGVVRSLSYNNPQDPAQYTVSTVWQTPGIIPTSIAYSSINAGSFDVRAEGEGSFVVAMKNSSGKTLYSWHIWVTNYNPDDPATQKSNNGFIFMDRNLGATSSTDYGLYYQWGRKDPFVPGSAPAFGIDTINSYTDNLELAIQYPDTFYAVPYTSPYDWIGSGVNNNLWSTADGKKAPFDPCPFGWRVPVVKDDLTGSPWYGFSGSSGNGATYPLAGYLNAFSGARDDATEEGGVWGASARGQQAYVYKFKTGAPVTPPSAFRANAYPVRCVKDTR